MNQKIWIRADGGAKIGWGHIVRSLALANMLKNLFDIEFALINSDPEIHQVISKEGFNFTQYKSEELFFDSIKQDSFVVIDGYSFDETYQLKLKEKCSALIFIDDLHNIKFYADLVINHAPGVDKSIYKHDGNTRFLLGPKYALLRPDFLESAQQVQEVQSYNANMLICFGGADPKNLTYQSIKIAKEFSFIKKIIVVTGASYRYKDELDSLINQWENIESHSNISSQEMRALMLSADYAIVPSSGMIFEALACKLNIISGHYVANQIELHNGFLENKAFISAKGFDHEDLKNALIELQKNQTNLNTSTLIDGLSGDRILSEFISLKPNFRISNENDSQLIYDLINDPYTRAQSYSTEAIPFESHNKWYREKLKIGNDKWLIFSDLKNDVIGMVRLTKEETNWLIGVTVDKNHRGLGIGSKTLRIASNYALKEVSVPIFAYIKKLNIASIKSFKKSGFSFKKELLIKEISSHLYIYGNSRL